MLTDHLKLSVYKFTRKDKETDERAIETAKKKLTSGILNRITSKESEIIVEKTEHNFRGIWKINAKRCVEYSQQKCYEIPIEDDNVNCIEIKTENGKQKLAVESNFVKLEATELGYDETNIEVVTEQVKIQLDKKKQEYIRAC